MPRVHSTLAEIVAFLEPHPPFAGRGPDALEEIARSAEIEYFPRESVILDQGGAPARFLYTVFVGAVELLDGEDVVDVLEAGESFGHPSLVASTPPVLGARAREDVLCLMFPAEAAVRLLANPVGLQYVASSLEDRLRWATAKAARATPWGIRRVGDHVRPSPVLDASTSIRDAALEMTGHATTTAVVSEPGRPPSLVSDSDLRKYVVTGHVPPESPLSALRLERALVADRERLAADLAVELLRTGAEHAIVVDARRTPVGVVDLVSLLDLDSPSLVAMRRGIDRATDPETVATVVEPLPKVAVGLLDAGLEPLDVLELLSTTTDAVTRRLTELARAQIGEPPVPWAWLALGSEARGEQTMATDQDNALAFDGGTADVGPYFERFASLVNDWLVECGYAACRAGVMARNPGWRLSRDEWLELVEEWLTAPTERDVRMAMIGLDVRQIAGPLTMEDELHAALASAPAHPYFLERLTRAALVARPPLGFLRGLVVERSGAHVGTLDLKAAGTAPIVDIARRHALATGSTVTPTLLRLRDAARSGDASVETCAELESAFVIINRVRLQHQASRIERGLEPDNHVDPRELAPPDKRALKDAFRAIARAQHELEPRTATRIP